MGTTADPTTSQLVVGTYTERLPHVDGKAEGILACAFGGEGFGPVSVVAASRNPSFVALNAAGDRCYCVNETTEFEGSPGGGVTAFRRDPASGLLSELNTRSSAGVEPCHVALDPTGRFVLVANYRSGSVAVFPVAEDGSLGEMSGHDQHLGSSVDPVRQSGPHAHMAAFDPVTGELLVPDLGLDAIVAYRLTAEGKLEERPSSRVDLAKGAGPRHLAFHQNSRDAFVVNELDNTVVSLRREGERLVERHVVSTLPEGFGAHSQAAAVRVSATGRHVFASNRGPESDSIAMLAFEEATGRLELVHLEPSGGREPREILPSPDGQFLLVANQDSGTIVCFEIDEERPGLREVSVAEVPTPVCLVLA